MTLLIFADSHGNVSQMEEISKKEPHNRIIFLGDREQDIETLINFNPQESIITVPGNNDYSGFASKTEKIIEISGFRLLCCHGHKYNVKQTYDRLFYSAKKKNCDVALFGHTHLQYAERSGGLLLLNPGSVGYRGEYALLKIGSGIIEYEQKRNIK